MQFINGLSFIINYSDKLIIPELDISKCSIEDFTPNTLNEWKLFCNSLNDLFDNVVKKLKKKKYITTINNNLFIKIPYNFPGCIWENYPNLYNCDGNQILLYLDKTQTKLSNVFIKTSPFQNIINCNITPETFNNLSIDNYAHLTDILIKNGETNPTIWCAIACWWNYQTELTNNIYQEQTVIGNFGTWIEKRINIKNEKETLIQIETDDDLLINILNTYCCPKIYNRCNWFMMLHARAINNQSIKLFDWITNNKQFIIWDADLLSDTPSFAFNECYSYYMDIDCVMEELKKRFI